MIVRCKIASIFVLFFVTCVSSAGTEVLGLTPSFYAIYFNQFNSEKTFFTLQRGNDELYLGGDDLESLHINLLAYQGDPIIFQDIVYYRLDKFPQIVYKIDLEKMIVNLNAGPDALTTTNLNIAPQTHLTPMLANGAYFNYYLNSSGVSLGPSTLNNYSANNILLQANIFNTLGIGSSSFLVKDSNGGQQASRLMTNWIYTNPDTMRSLTLGDSFSRISAWNQSVGFAGIQYSSDFTTQPNFITSPTPSVQGVATLPSNVQVFINNARVSSQQVEAGSFTLNNIPVVNGDGTMRIVTTNIIGEQIIETMPYSASSNLLKNGLSSYSIEAGFLRNNFANSNFSYTQPMLSGSYSYGITNLLTLQSHLEASAHVQALGIGGIYLIPRFGVFNASIAPSLNRQYKPGVLWLAGYSNNALYGISFGANIQGTTAYFSDLGYVSTGQPPALQMQVYAGTQWRGSVITTGYTQQNNRPHTINEFINVFENSGDVGTNNYVNIPNIGGPNNISGSTSFLTLSMSKPFYRHWNLMGIALQTIRGTPNTTFMLNLTYIFDNQNTATGGININNGSYQEQFRFYKPLPTNTGIGYQLQVANNHDQRLGNQPSYVGNIQAQNTIGQYQIGVVRSYDNTNSYQILASGAVGWLDKHMFLARPINNSFALVEVGVPGVRVSTNNNMYGRTNYAGNLVVTTINPYLENKVAINPDDLPFNATVPNPVRVINPYQGAGLVARFIVPIQLGGLAVLKNPVGDYIHSGATVANINGDEIAMPSMVGDNGIVYLIGLKMGKNQLIVDNDDKKCIINVTITTSMLSTTKDPLTNLGNYTCQPLID